MPRWVAVWAVFGLFFATGVWLSTMTFLSLYDDYYRILQLFLNVASIYLSILVALVTLAVLFACSGETSKVYRVCSKSGALFSILAGSVWMGWFLVNFFIGNHPNLLDTPGWDPVYIHPIYNETSTSAMRIEFSLHKAMSTCWASGELISRPAENPFNQTYLVPFSNSQFHHWFNPMPPWNSTVEFGQCFLSCQALALFPRMKCDPLKFVVSLQQPEAQKDNSRDPKPLAPIFLLYLIPTQFLTCYLVAQFRKTFPETRADDRHEDPARLAPTETTPLQDETARASDIDLSNLQTLEQGGGQAPAEDEERGRAEL